MRLLNLLRPRLKAVRRTSAERTQTFQDLSAEAPGDEPRLPKPEDAWTVRSIGGIAVRLAREPLNSEAAIAAALQSCRIL
ncbi:MAG: hypothetical protein Q7T63_21560, partial [Burkholderiaceae bacterium]|nr:hypothetical protein [Burkholderiaceae bacterium]